MRRSCRAFARLGPPDAEVAGAAIRAVGSRTPGAVDPPTGGERSPPHSPPRPGPPRGQPPRGRRHRPPGVRHPAPGRVPRQGRVLHRLRPAPPARRAVPHGSGLHPGRPRPRQGRARRPRRGPQGARPRRRVRDLPRRHPVPRRAAAPRPHRRRLAGAGDRRHGRPGRAGGHPTRPAGRRAPSATRAGADPVRPPARLLALRRPGGLGRDPAGRHGRGDGRHRLDVGPGYVDRYHPLPGREAA